jgi:four helix bundle protein
MFSYEKLEVYKKSFELNQKVYRFLKSNKAIPKYTKDQLGRATLSIMLNIVEGSGKFSNHDRRNFYIIARGSAFECSALVSFLHGENEIDEQTKIDWLFIYEEISRMLYVMIKNLDTQIK